MQSTAEIVTGAVPSSAAPGTTQLFAQIWLPAASRVGEPSGMDPHPLSRTVLDVLDARGKPGNGIQKVARLTACPEKHLLSVLPKTLHWTGPGGIPYAWTLYPEVYLLNTEYPESFAS